MRVSIASITLGAATLVTATVNLGTNLKGDSVAWYQDHSPCGYVFVSAKGTNPCGKRFTISGHTYYVSWLSD
jgi:hypothetical protein